MTKLFFAALLSSVTVPAHAEPATIASSTVETADLDLTTASGRRLLDLRLLHAVKQVCGEASDADLAGNNEIRRCRVASVARTTCVSVYSDTSRSDSRIGVVFKTTPSEPSPIRAA